MKLVSVSSNMAGDRVSSRVGPDETAKREKILFLLGFEPKSTRQQPSTLLGSFNSKWQDSIKYWTVDVLHVCMEIVL